MIYLTVQENLLQMGNKYKICSFENQSELYIQFLSGHFCVTLSSFSINSLFSSRKYNSAVSKPVQC